MMSDTMAALELFRFMADKREVLPRVWIATDWGADYLLFETEEFRRTTLQALIRLWPDVPRAYQARVGGLVGEFADHLNKLTVGDVARNTDNPWLCLDVGALSNCSVCGNRFANVCHNNVDSDGSACPQALWNKCSETKIVRRSVTNELFYTEAVHAIFAVDFTVQALNSLWEQARNHSTHLSSDEVERRFVELAHSSALQDAFLNTSRPEVDLNTSEDSLTEAWRRDAKPELTILTTRTSLTASGDRVVVMEKVGSWVWQGFESTPGTAVMLDEGHEWTIDWGRLLIDDRTGYARSDCRLPCSVGAVPEINSRDLCCWTCVRCDGNNVTDQSGTRCRLCPGGQQPNEAHSQCVSLPVGVPPAYDASLTLSTVLGSVVFVVVLVTIVAMLCKRKTTAMRSADRNLSLIMLFSMLLSLVSISMLYVQTHPSECWCGVIGLILLPWQVFPVAALFVKTSRLARLWLFTTSGKGSPDGWTFSTAAQVVFASLLVFFGELIEVNLFLHIGGRIKELYTTTHVYQICQPAFAQLTVDAYIILIVLATNCCAFLMRKMPTIANESRNLFLASFCLTAAWLLFTPIYYLSTDHRPTILSLRIIAQVLLIWSWIFLPRLYTLKDSDRKLLYRNSIANSLEADTSRLRVRQLQSLSVCPGDNFPSESPDTRRRASSISVARTCVSFVDLAANGNGSPETTRSYVEFRRGSLASTRSYVEFRRGSLASTRRSPAPGDSPLHSTLKAKTAPSYGKHLTVHTSHNSVCIEEDATPTNGGDRGSVTLEEKPRPESH